MINLNQINCVNICSDIKGKIASPKHNYHSDTLLTSMSHEKTSTSDSTFELEVQLEGNFKEATTDSIHRQEANSADVSPLISY